MYKKILLLFVFGTLFSCSQPDPQEIIKQKVIDKLFSTFLFENYKTCVGALGKLQFDIRLQRKEEDRKKYPDVWVVEFLMTKPVGGEDLELYVQHLYNASTDLLDKNYYAAILNGQDITGAFGLGSALIQGFCSAN